MRLSSSWTTLDQTGPLWSSAAESAEHLFTSLWNVSFSSSKHLKLYFPADPECSSNKLPKSTLFRFFLQQWKHFPQDRYQHHAGGGPGLIQTSSAEGPGVCFGFCRPLQNLKSRHQTEFIISARLKQLTLIYRLRLLFWNVHKCLRATGFGAKIEYFVDLSCKDADCGSALSVNKEHQTVLVYILHFTAAAGP